MSETITNGGQPQCGSVNSTATVRCKGVAGHGGSHSSPARFNGHTVELQWMDRDAAVPPMRPKWDVDGMNDLLRETLTIYATLSAQVRDNQFSLIIYHREGAPRSSEQGTPYVSQIEDARLLRDLLNAATDRGVL